MIILKRCKLELKRGQIEMIDHNSKFETEAPLFDLNWTSLIKRKMQRCQMSNLFHALTCDAMQRCQASIFFQAQYNETDCSAVIVPVFPLIGLAFTENRSKSSSR